MGLYQDGEHACAKVFNKQEIFLKELSIAKKLNEICNVFPKVLGVDEYEENSCIIYERLGEPLSVKMDLQPRRQLSLKTIIQVGTQILDQLRLMHQAGYVHCDLKPENILVGRYGEQGMLSQVYLIDFGFSRAIETVETFELGSGNVAFASPNSLRNRTIFPRDDLISLALMLTYMMNKFIPHFNNEDDIEDQKRSRIKMEPATYCRRYKCKELREFLELVFKTAQEKTPDYVKLRFLLTKALLDMNTAPTKWMDWSTWHLSQVINLIPRERINSGDEDITGAED